MFRRFKYIIEKNLDLKRSFDFKKDITREEISEYIKKGAMIIDVRSPQEYMEGHINGAISIPDYKIKRNVENYIKDKNQIIILYCSTGHRSKYVQNILENSGYTNVYNVYDGVII